MYYTYILKSSKSGRYYVGHTANVQAQLEVHNTGGVVATRNKGPWVCVHVETFDSRTAANRRELEI